MPHVSQVDFNAGVVAAGEAQIESTVTGNDSSKMSSSEKDSALKDQSQIYLPINNAITEVRVLACTRWLSMRGRDAVSNHVHFVFFHRPTLF